MLKLFGVRIDDVSESALEDHLLGWLQDVKPHLIFTPNPEFILAAKRNRRFVDLLNQSDLSLPDGVGLKFATAALTPERLVHRQTGIDTLTLIARICEREKKRLLLLGGIRGVAADTAAVFKRRWPELDVVWIEPEFIPGDFESLSIPVSLVQEIQARRPDVLAVALGQGRQERFILELNDQIPTLKIAIGVGGSFDTISGRLKRAPSWIRRYGLEWLWRVLIEPKRIHRIFRAVVIFPMVVICDTLKHRGFLHATTRVLVELKKHFSSYDR